MSLEPVETLDPGQLDHTSILNRISDSLFDMRSDFHEEWEDFSDDWFDNADEIVDRGQRMYLEMCLELPSVQKE